jgi:hypothetical protein
VVASGTVALWPRQDQVTRANYNRIQIGMARAEVEAILGPPGDYAGIHSRLDYSRLEGDFNMLATFDRYGADRAGYWEGYEAVILLKFDTSAHVLTKATFPNRPIDDGPLGNFLNRLLNLW